MFINFFCLHLIGYYYLVDVRYANTKVVLALYRGTRYHFSEWKDKCALLNHEEYFNMKYSSVRNVIEHCFGLLKIR